MKNTNKLILFAIILLTSFSTLLSTESTEYSYGRTFKINLEILESFKAHLGFKNIVEIKNFLEAIQEFYYHESVLNNFFASGNNGDLELYRKAYTIISEYQNFKKNLLNLQKSLARNENFIDLSSILMMIKSTAITEYNPPSNNEVDRSIVYADRSFPKLKEKFNQLSGLLFTKSEL